MLRQAFIILFYFTRTEHCLLPVELSQKGMI